MATYDAWGVSWGNPSAWGVAWQHTTVEPAPPAPAPGTVFGSRDDRARLRRLYALLARDQRAAKKKKEIQRVARDVQQTLIASADHSIEASQLYGVLADFLAEAASREELRRRVKAYLEEGEEEEIAILGLFH